MNAVIFWRVVWKEYRQQRALWFAIAAAGILMQVGVIAYCMLYESDDLANRLFTVALSVPVLYSLGCGATLFAGEHEAETFAFQQALPVEASRVFCGKLAFAIVSALALFPALWFVAWALSSWELPDANWHLKLWAGGSVATVEVLFWAVLGSLLLRRVLPAAIVSGLIAVVLGYSSLVLVLVFGRMFQQQVDEYFSTLPMRSLCGLLALAVAVRLGQRWFAETPKLFAMLPSATQSGAARSSRATTSGVILWRLMWHEWRQSRATLLWLVSGYFVLSFWFGYFLQSPAEPQWEVMLALLPVLATVVGASTFWADQQGQSYHFFAEHGVRPRLVWLSRQIVGGLVVAGIAGIACAPLLSGWWPEEDELPRAGVGLAIVMFASGQACSIFMRSGIVAIFTAIFCSILLFFWAVMLNVIGVSWFVSTLPLPLIFWWATWLYAPQWIQQRTSWRVRIAAVASIVIPLAAVVSGVIAYRAYEIPAVQLSFTPPAIGTTAAVSLESRETARMYSEAIGMLQRKLEVDDLGESQIGERDEQWQRGIGLFVAASGRPACHFANWNDLTNEGFFDGRILAQAAVLEARQCLAEDDLSGAADLYDAVLRLAAHYYQQPSSHAYIPFGQLMESYVWPELPKWVAQPGQDREAVLQMLGRLQVYSEENEPDWEIGAMELHKLMHRFVDLDQEAISGFLGIDPKQRRLVMTLAWLMPWERARTRRLLDLHTESELQRIALYPTLPPSRLWPPSADLEEITLTRRDGRRFVVSRDAFLSWLRTTPWLQNGGGIGFVRRSTDDNIHMHRRAVQVQLALAAWWMEHDELPLALHELVGQGLDQLPVDPYTGQPFVYVREGVDEEVLDEDAISAAGLGMGMMEGMSSMGGPENSLGSRVDMAGMGGLPMMAGMSAPTKLVRTDPFIWSPAESLYYAPRTKHGPAVSPAASDFRELPNRFQNQQGTTLVKRIGNQLSSDLQLLYQGVRFSIPRPAAALRRDEPSED